MRSRPDTASAWRRASLVGCGLLVTLASPPVGATPGHPWMARHPPVTPLAAHQLNDVSRWPAEPDAPSPVDGTRFAAAVEHLCGKDRLTPPLHLAADAPPSSEQPTTESAPLDPPATAPSSTPSLGQLVLGAAGEARIDPFLLAGLMQAQSRCRAGLETRWGYGLLGIHPELYRSPGAPAPPGERAWWHKAALLDPATNLRLGALLMKMWEDSHVELDTMFRGVPHRGAAAHFVWGDVVRGSGAEDQILTARRRLIAYYEQRPEPVIESPLGISLLCPLEGSPRVASSGPGEDRAGGKREHRGIDLGAAIGEPVRSLASGTVIFAGANIPGTPRKSLSPERAVRYRWRHLGPGGIYVCIEHAPARHIVSCYMHLDSYKVNEGQLVEAGQEIGRVGRTGVQVSPPHLHFELRVDDRHVNPVRYLGALIIPPKATQTYRYAVRAKRSRLARAHSAAGSEPITQKM